MLGAGSISHHVLDAQISAEEVGSTNRPGQASVREHLWEGRDGGVQGWAVR